MVVESTDDSSGEDASSTFELGSWVARHQEGQAQRVVGWQAGASLASTDVQEILTKSKRARHEYKGLRKVMSNQGKSREANDPLAGLPPTWQAFWSAVPHLDPQAAYRQFRKERQRQARAGEQAAGPAAGGSAAAGGGGKRAELEEVEEEARRLEEECAAQRRALAARERACAEWDKKLARVRILDRDEGELSRRVFRKLESASYEYGIMEGKIRSSDIYFHYLFEDGKTTHEKRVASLTRSHALMGKQIDDLKAEVRGLLKAAAEAQPSSDPLQTSDRRRQADSTEGASGASGLGEGETALVSAESSMPASQPPAP
mmetsp:Transcript_96598/g.288387  ORF Transcript_96598/g.288387 Transcript_96598/m.288387 type:complete len:317 (-) Transcript_96598:42-992(-)|eukprot:CAMPEP_0175242186 /NCGR_PEP_ID=MMETSP0093-20121207/30938_1 /TAXON_ID=311494 /ORGANISM="Alexandrium monilatum, Strain CCMP3105" /LENGTH=316 /DNA_ID=CAMNT_0016536253 /DNA_START=58 /DNA_END=1008 /DNA_ORIENTATION=-